MGCLSSGDLKEEKTLFALCNTLYRIPVLSSRECPRSRDCSVPNRRDNRGSETLSANFTPVLAKHSF